MKRPCTAGEEEVECFTPAMVREAQFPAVARKVWNDTIVADFSAGHATVSLVNVEAQLRAQGHADIPRTWLQPIEHYEKSGWMVHASSDGKVFTFHERSIQFNTGWCGTPNPNSGRFGSFQ